MRASDSRLVKLDRKAERKPIYTDFEDELGHETAVELPGFVAAGRSSDSRPKPEPS